MIRRVQRMPKHFSRSRKGCHCHGVIATQRSVLLVISLVNLVGVELIYPMPEKKIPAQAHARMDDGGDR